MLEDNIKKEAKVVDNEAYKERFQFLLWVNDNIICQRYFKINGYNNDSLRSLQFKETMDNVVTMIKEDLISKSRIFMWYTRDEPIKMKGFANNYDELDYSDVVYLTSPDYKDSVKLSNGEIIEKDYFNYAEGTEDSYADTEDLKPWDVTFKFQMLIDEQPVYERIWDGTVYPKYVRNGVDLTNSDVLYKDKEPSSLHFSCAIISHMTIGKIDLVYHIIKQICEVMSYKFEDSNKYTKRMKYGDKNYVLSTYNKDWVDAARQYCAEKTKAYQIDLMRDERYKDTFGLTPGQFEYIENRL
jgi:hypothetical protein